MASTTAFQAVGLSSSLSTRTNGSRQRKGEAMKLLTRDTEHNLSFSLDEETEEILIERGRADSVRVPIEELFRVVIVLDFQRYRDGTGSTLLSPRDAKLFLAMLDDENSEPNAALRKAAERYREAVDDGSTLRRKV